MLELRPYQTIAIHQVFDCWRGGARSVVLVAPTGCGKRVIALWLMDYAAKAGRRVLFVGNRRLLVTQAQNDAEKYEIPHGVIMADAEGGDPSSTNQLASIQTLESWYFYDSKWSSEVTGRGLPECDLCVVDEVHTEAVRYRQLLDLYPRAKFLGLTATPVGTEGRSIVPQPYDVLVEPIKNSELIQQFRDTGIGLLPTVVYAPSEPNIEGVKIVRSKTGERGEYNQAQLGRAVHECTVFADVFAEWHRHARDRATVAFVPGIPFGRDLVRQFNDRLGPGAAHLIEAKTKHHEREEIFEAITTGGAKILVSVDVLKEGVDLPILSCGVDLQPNSQLRSYWQKLGRIKRPYRDQSGHQQDAVWLDFAGNYWKFTHPNQDPEWPQGEQTTQDAIKAARQAGTASQAIMCPKCGLVRERGPVCACGYRCQDPIRRIRMGNGQLREIPAVEHAKREKSESEKLYGKWQSQLYGALHAGRTYSQAARLYHQATGEYPKESWPFVFPKDHLDWRRRVRDQNTTRDLSLAFRRSKP